MKTTKQTSPSKGVVTRTDAAEYLAISTRYLDILVAAGELKRLHIGRKPVYRVADLDAYLDRLAMDSEGDQ